jgi:hypothetical protein
MTDREMLIQSLTGSSAPLPTNATEIITLTLELAVAEATALAGEGADEESLRARAIAGRLAALRFFVAGVGDWEKKSGGAS